MLRSPWQISRRWRLWRFLRATSRHKRATGARAADHVQQRKPTVFAEFVPLLILVTFADVIATRRSDDSEHLRQEMGGVSRHAIQTPANVRIEISVVVGAICPSGQRGWTLNLWCGSPRVQVPLAQQ